MADDRRDNASLKPDAVIAEGGIAGLNASAKPHAVMAETGTAGRDKAGAKPQVRTWLTNKENGAS